jgi:NitT/TauT family transport system substrate-binding protein
MAPLNESLPPLRVEYTNWWGDYTLLVAQELGLFEKYNVSVEPVYFGVFSEALPALATGSIDGGLFGIGDAINTNASSAIKIVAIYDDGGTNYIVSSANILSAAELKGKKVGVPLGSVYELYVLETLKKGGLTTRDVTLVNTEVEDLPNSLGFTIDAGYASDPIASDVIASGGNLLFKSSETNSINPDAIVFREDVVQQRPEDIQAFLQAWFEAVDYRKSNPEQANQIVAKALDMTVDELKEDSYIYTTKDNRFFISSQEIYGTSRLSAAINTNSEFLISIGALSKKPDLDQLIDLSYIP